MRRWLVVGLMTVAIAPVASGAGTGEKREKVHDWWYRCKVDWHRNNAWPEPFATADRMAERQPFCLMVDNGWKMQNTVGTYPIRSELATAQHGWAAPREVDRAAGPAASAGGVRAEGRNPR